MIRRPISIVLAAAALALAACSGGDDGPETPPGQSLAPTARPADAGVDDVEGAKASPECLAQVKLLRVSVVGALNDASKSGKDYMERAHPGLTVELAATAANYGELVTQISADQAAGRTVDVAVAGFDHLSVFANDLGAQELSPRLLRASYDQRFTPLGVVGGRQIGIPQQVSVPVLIYNQDVLDAAGVDPATLTTTDGVLAAAEKIKQHDPSIQPIDLPTGQQFGQWFLNTLASSKGAPIQTDSGAPAINTPQAREAADFLAAVAKYGPQSNDPTTQGLLRFGIQKKTAMVGATVASLSGGLRFIQDQGDKGFRVGVEPFPTLPGGQQHPVAGGNALTVLSKDQCQREVAAEFVVAMLSPDVVAASTEAFSFLPVDTQAINQLDSFYQRYPQLRQFNDLAGVLVKPPYWPGARGGEVAQMLANQVAKIESGADPGATLADGQSQAEELTR